MDNIFETEEFYNQNKKHNKRRSARKQEGKGLRIFLIILICILSLLIVLVTVAKVVGVLDFGTEVPDNIKTSTYQPIVREDGTIAERKQENYNFLVVGQDLRANLTDVMMIINYDVTDGNMTLMQLPRDTLVVLDAYACMNCKVPVTTAEGRNGSCNTCGGSVKTLCTGYRRKLNSVYHQYYSSLNSDNNEENVRFGMEGLALTFAQSLNINIDYYAHMDLAGFRAIVDTIGGVDMYVPYDMHYEDPYQDLYIHLYQGQQNLNGEKAEQFVRFRSGYIRADISRQDAQKLFMVAFLQNFKEKITVTKAVPIASTMLKYVTHSVPVSDLDYYAKTLLSMDFSNVTMLSAPFSETGGDLVLHRHALRDIINAHYNLYDTDIPDSQFDTERIFTVVNDSYINSKYLTEEEFEGEHSAEDIKENGLEIY
ncbi:MAG: LCP family protein [Clostridia bacterium]|nr:LCP family protein [Clostridia bacterium]